jgi:hypothetical protein
VSAAEVVDTYTPAGFGTAAGARYSTAPAAGAVGGEQGLDPATQISPTVALPFATSSTLQETAVLLLPVTSGVSTARLLTAASAAIGVKFTLIPLTTEIVAAADSEESAVLVAVKVIGFAGGSEEGAV